MKKNIRAYYEEHYGIKIPADFRILHIDGKKSNTHISNLLLLPKDIYADITKAYNDLCRVGLSYNFKKAFQAALRDDHQCDNFCAALEFFEEALSNVFIWVARKHFEDLGKAGVELSDRVKQSNLTYRELKR